MNTYTTSIPSKAEVYMRTLSPLSDNVKIELINLLSLSLLKKEEVAPGAKDIDLYHCFHGNWGNGMTTEEYCDMLRNEGVNCEITD